MASSGYRSTFECFAALIRDGKFLVSTEETYINAIESSLPQVTL